LKNVKGGRHGSSLVSPELKLLSLQRLPTTSEGPGIFSAIEGQRSDSIRSLGEPATVNLAGCKYDLERGDAAEFEDAAIAAADNLL
jgi:hypothetical protein